ncbi:LysR family transcriptional regulator [Pararhodobacter sp.]|uniref:LysR family transcriptional regulator n=1 Tax=Pararhodobacter sp. TaxID=2127056 RepID=UPI002AFED526|nr:LysR family transcriptional regulator [Pararhodobacter sp.]
MSEINLARLDLNLLRLFLIVFDSQSVSTAAQQLGLSQPAASSALNRLRDQLRDPLFVRGKGGMVPTHYAAQIAPDVRTALHALEAALVPAKAFDPATSNHVLRLSLSGLGEALLLPMIAKCLIRQAPGLRFRNLSIAKPQVGAALENGDIDLAIGILDSPERGILGVDLFAETYSAIIGANHAAPPGLDLGNAKLVLAAPEATYASDIERWVNDQGYAQNIIMRLRHFGGLSELLSDINAIAIVPTQFADRLIATEAVREIARISDLKERPVRMIWHQRLQTDATARWIRQQIMGLFLPGG